MMKEVWVSHVAISGFAPLPDLDLDSLQKARPPMAESPATAQRHFPFESIIRIYLSHDRKSSHDPNQIAAHSKLQVGKLEGTPA